MVSPDFIDNSAPLKLLLRWTASSSKVLCSSCHHRRVHAETFYIVLPPSSPEPHRIAIAPSFSKIGCSTSSSISSSVSPHALLSTSKRVLGYPRPIPTFLIVSLSPRCSATVAFLLHLRSPLCYRSGHPPASSSVTSPSLSWRSLCSRRLPPSTVAPPTPPLLFVLLPPPCISSATTSTHGTPTPLGFHYGCLSAVAPPASSASSPLSRAPCFLCFLLVLSMFSLGLGPI